MKKEKSKLVSADTAEGAAADTAADARSANIFRKEVQGNLARYRKILHFTSSTTKAAAIMLLCAIVSVAIANSGAYTPFLEFWETEFGFVLGGGHASLSFAEIINDVFMAIFFLLVGLEIKYEMTVGELTNIRQALLPILAACGGVLAPIAIYSIFNITNPDTAHGWGVPTATDIGFALGIMALLGNRVPNGVRVFLSTLAVADDIIAIIVIAVFYGHTPSFFWLGMAALVLLMLIVLNRRHVYSLLPYLLLGVVLWFCVFQSGVHATIAGVLLAFTIPSGSRVNLKNFAQWSGDHVAKASEQFDENEPVLGQKEYLSTVGSLSTVAREVIPPATRLEKRLFPWVYFMILPLFALTNADVCLQGANIMQTITSPVFLGIFFGLLLGKPIGIMLMSFIVVKTKLASLSENVTWLHMLGASILGGVGFTMAIFVANLAFADEVLVTAAKLGILLASACAGVIGFAFLMAEAKRAKVAGVAYLAVAGHQDNLQTADIEAAAKSRELLDSIESPLIRAEIDARIEQGDLTAEVVIDLGENNRRSDEAALHGREGD